MKTGSIIMTVSVILVIEVNSDLFINMHDTELCIVLSGKNCEEDINECESMPCQFGGTCLERSDQSLYIHNPDSILPEVFNNVFAYENASG